MRDKRRVLRIGLDLDGVVANWSNTAREWVNKRYSLNIPPDEPPYWDWVKDQMSEEAWKWLWNGAIDNGLFFALEPYPGAQEFVKGLTKLGDVIAITSRPKGSRKDTLYWWFDNGFPTIDGFNWVQTGEDKKNVLTNVLIEDNLDYAEAYYRECLSYPQVIILDRPYNQDAGEASWPLGMRRAHSYAEVLEKVRCLKEALEI